MGVSQFLRFFLDGLLKSRIEIFHFAENIFVRHRHTDLRRDSLKNHSVEIVERVCSVAFDVQSAEIFQRAKSARRFQHVFDW